MRAEEQIAQALNVKDQPLEVRHLDELDAEYDDDLLAEYDFSGAVRGKYFERYRQGTNVVLLDPDIAAVFRDSAAVNDTLRLFGLHPLGGDRKGTWAVSVSGNWRVTFKFVGKDADAVDYEDYH